jgi:hypothetical protein
LILATSLGSISLKALRLIWGTRRKTDKTQMHTHTHTHTKLGTYVTVFVAFFDTKTENSDRLTRRPVPVIPKSAGGFYPETLLFTLCAGIMHLKFFKSSSYDTAYG